MNISTENEQATVDEAVRWVARRDRGLTAQEERALAQWLENPECARVFEKYIKSWRSFAGPREAGKADVLRDKIVTMERTKRARRAAMGSIVAGLFLLGIVGWRMTPWNQAQAESNRSVVILPRHENLPDGSIVDSPPGAQFTVNYTKAFRRIHLTKGEALFTVAKDSDRPFIVDAGGYEVRAVGTAFSVQLGSANVDVLVTEGKVAVDRTIEIVAPTNADTDIRFGSLVLVKAGEQVSVQRQHSELKPVVVPIAASQISERLAWRNPQVEFSAAPLSEVVATINRYREVKYVIADLELAKTELSGLFRADDSKAFERMLGKGLKIEFVHGENQVVLRHIDSR